MNVLELAKHREMRLRLELVSVQAFIRQYEAFAAEAATEPQGHSAHPAPAASEVSLSSDAPHSAQAEAPEAGVSEHPEAHSMATGGEKDAGTSASGHEPGAAYCAPADPQRSEGATREDAWEAASDPNADGPSAGGRAETDAYPAAPNPEAKASTGNAVSTTASAVSVPQATEAPEADGSGDVSRPSDGGGSVAPISETTGPRPSAGEAARAPASPAPSLMERVVECRKAHPDWPAKMVAEHVGAAKSTVMTYGYRAGFGWKTEAQYKAAQKAASEFTSAGDLRRHYDGVRQRLNGAGHA